MRIRLIGTENELKDLKNLPNEEELYIQIISKLQKEHLKNVYLIVVKKNLVGVTIKSNLSIEHYQILSIPTINLLHLNVLSSFRENDSNIKKLISKLPKLKCLSLKNLEEEYIKLSDLLPGNLFFLESLELDSITIDESFNQVLANSKLKELYYFACSFESSFKFNINLKKLLKLTFFSCENIPFKSLHQSMKGNSEKLEIFIYQEQLETEEKEMDCLGNILFDYKLSLFDFRFHSKGIQSFLDQDLNFHIENFKLDLLDDDYSIIPKLFSKIYGLFKVSIRFDSITKEIFQILMDQKKLKELELYGNIYFTSNDLFSFLNHLKIKKLTILSKEYQNSKEFFELLKDNVHLESLDIQFWDESIFNIISSHKGLETLKISLFKRDNKEITRFFQSLKQNSFIRYIEIIGYNYITKNEDCFNPVSDYLSSNPNITHFIISINKFDHSFLKSLSLNTKLKELEIRVVNPPTKNEIESQLEFLFKYNFTIQKILISKFKFDEFDHYLKRNQKIQSIYKFKNEGDIHFKFD